CGGGPRRSGRSCAMDAAIAIVLLVLIGWGPTFLTYRRLRQHRVAVKRRHLAVAFALELAAIVGLAAVLRAAAVANAGAYLLVIALFVGAGGAQLFLRVRSRAPRT